MNPVAWNSLSAGRAPVPGSVPPSRRTARRLARGICLAVGLSLTLAKTAALADSPGDAKPGGTSVAPAEATITGTTNHAGLRTITPAALARLEVTDLKEKAVLPFAADARKATVLVFVMHECPVANSYAPEIARIQKEYGPKGIPVQVVYIEDDLTPAQARAHARDYGYQTGTLLDPHHRLVRATGATVSPEAAVVLPSGQVAYLGRIDDRVADFGKKRPQPTQRDLRQSLDAILAGKPVPNPRTKAVGCYIPDSPIPKKSATAPPRR